MHTLTNKCQTEKSKKNCIYISNSITPMYKVLSSKSYFEERKKTTNLTYLYP